MTTLKHEPCHRCKKRAPTLFDPDTGKGTCEICEREQQTALQVIGGSDGIGSGGLPADPGFDYDPRSNHANKSGAIARANLMRLVDRLSIDGAADMIIVDILGALPVDMIPPAPSLRHFAWALLCEASEAIDDARSNRGVGRVNRDLPPRVKTWIRNWAKLYAKSKEKGEGRIGRQE